MMLDIGHASGWFFQYPIVPVPGLLAVFWKNPKLVDVAATVVVIVRTPFWSVPLLKHWTRHRSALAPMTPGSLSAAAAS